MSLTVTFWGTRGSIPTPGRTTARYGGNTPCLAVHHARGLLVLDAGTGIRGLGRALEASRTAPLEIDLLLSHTHWDHIQGFPFFRPLFREHDRLTVHGPRPAAGTLEEVLRRQMDQTVFPVPLEAARARLGVSEISARELTIGGLAIRTFPAIHPAPTLGYSIAKEGEVASLIYLTDNELNAFDAGGHRAGLVRFLRHAHVLVHDAMYFEAEGRERRGFGHSTAREAVRIALEAECRRVVLFHHDPDHDDDALERLLDEALDERERAGGPLEIDLATESSTLALEGVT